MDKGTVATIRSVSMRTRRLVHADVHTSESKLPPFHALPSPTLGGDSVKMCTQGTLIDPAGSVPQSCTVRR